MLLELIAGTIGSVTAVFVYHRLALTPMRKRLEVLEAALADVIATGEVPFEHHRKTRSERVLDLTKKLRVEGASEILVAGEAARIIEAEINDEIREKKAR